MFTNKGNKQYIEEKKKNKQNKQYQEYKFKH